MIKLLEINSFSVLITKNSSLGNIIGYDNSKKIKYDGDGNVITNPDQMA